MRRRFVVSYDIADDGRRTKVFEVLKGYGDHVQYSVFLADLTPKELIELRVKMRKWINESEDQVLIVDLGRETRPLETSLEVLGKPYRPSSRSLVV